MTLTLPKLLALGTLAAALAACASTEPAASAGVRLAGDELHALVESSFAAAVPAYYLEGQSTLAIRVEGAADALSGTVLGLPVVAFEVNGEFEHRYTFTILPGTILPGEPGRFPAQLVIGNPIGGPSVYELVCERTPGGWTARVVGAVECL